jgi:prolyl-tRNA synthetase
VVGRGWADGTVELRNRFSGQTRELAIGAGLPTEITVAVSGD